MGRRQGIMMPVWRDLERVLQSTSAPDSDVSAELHTSTRTAASDWGIRSSNTSERWLEARPQLVENMLKATIIRAEFCQMCKTERAVIRCADCMSLSHLCCGCDQKHHHVYSLHNRSSLTNNCRIPLPPTVMVTNEGRHDTCARILPMELPQHICDCSNSVSVIVGRPVVFVNINGRYDLNLPELRCRGCCASWTPQLADLQQSGYWPATIQFCTVHDTDIFQRFREMKLVAPGSSRLSFIRMLEVQTKQHGRTGKVCSDTFYKAFMEWVISSIMQNTEVCIVFVNYVS
ncbi:uncharacterized protein LOC121709119 [Alosa sapidissima]|uniref:uncharacterized protein LOC121709119 n=1 Tax=Alosa sapidissima TaxID=34773 RepID=UPI001C08A16A|nr:uncharacterized protein LOC121709119 [Alosa sapidissima]